MWKFLFLMILERVSVSCGLNESINFIEISVLFPLLFISLKVSSTAASTKFNCFNRTNRMKINLIVGCKTGDFLNGSRFLEFSKVIFLNYLLKRWEFMTFFHDDNNTFYLFIYFFGHTFECILVIQMVDSHST